MNERYSLDKYLVTSPSPLSRTSPARQYPVCTHWIFREPVQLTGVISHLEPDIYRIPCRPSDGWGSLGLRKPGHTAGAGAPARFAAFYFLYWRHCRETCYRVRYFSATVLPIVKLAGHVPMRASKLRVHRRGGEANVGNTRRSKLEQCSRPQYSQVEGRIKPGPDRTRQPPYRPVPTTRKYRQPAAPQAIFLTCRVVCAEILPEVPPADGIYVLERRRNGPIRTLTCAVRTGLKTVPHHFKTRRHRWQQKWWHSTGKQKYILKNRWGIVI